jgi:anti-sigma B factor antagonist
MSLRIRTVDDEADTVVTLSGELDIASAPGLVHTVDTLVGAGRVRLTIDLTELAFCDSTGIGAFVRASNECHREGGYLRLAAPCENVTRILSVVGLLDAFPTYRTVAAAREGDRSALVISSV